MKDEPDLERLTTICREGLGKGESVEEVLLSMRGVGASKGLSARALQVAKGLTWEVAARTVHDSLAWADRRASDEEITEAVLAAFEADPDVKK